MKMRIDYVMQRGRRLALPQQVCTVTPGANQDFFSSTLRTTVASPTMPEAVFNYDLVTGEATLLQQEEFIERNESTVCPAFCSESSSNQDKKPPMSSASQKYIVENGGRDLLDLSNLYVCERVLVPSTDEVKVPLTLIYHRKFKRNGSNPALLIGYGAYSEVLETDWCSDRLSLLNRGWVLAFAHVRGGGELGKSWHHAGRLMKKANSIQDFLACATYLLDYKYAHQTRLAAWGISAGGLLVGAAINMCPNLFNAVILKVLPCFPPE
jgi:protease II